MFPAKGLPSPRHILIQPTSDWERDLSPRAFAELRSLSSERDPEMYAQGLLVFGQRLEASGNQPAAARIYSLLASHPSAPIPQHQARQHLDALAGKGGFGRRSEILLGQFSDSLLDPALLLGMGAASATFRATRWIALARNPGSKIAATLFASGAEALIFPLASRGVATALGRSIEGRPLENDIATSFLSLGAMRAMGWGVGSLARVREGFVGPRTALGMQQAGMLSGILLAQGLEEWAGLRAANPSSSRLADALTMLLHFNVAGHLVGRLGGRALDRAFPEFEGRPQRPSLWASQIPPTNARGQVLVPALGAGSGFRPQPGALPVFSPNLQMSLLDGPFGSGVPATPEHLGQVLTQKWRAAPDDPHLSKILEEAGKVRFYFREEDSRRALFNLLAHSQLRGMLRPGEGEFTAMEIQARALRVFRYVQELNPFRRATGSLYDYLMQAALERVLQASLQTPKVHAFDRLMRIAAVYRSPRDLEDLLEDYALNYPFQYRGGLWQVTLADHVGWLGILKQLRLAKPIRNILGKYLASFAYGEFSDPFRDRDFNYLLLKNNGGPPRRVPMAGEFSLLALNDLKKKLKANPTLTQLLEAGLKGADQSRLPLLYLDRIFKILATGDLEEKLTEMAHPEAFDPGVLEKLSQFAPPGKHFKAGEKIDGSIYTGFVTDPALAEKFAEFYGWLPVLLQPAEMQLRRGEFRKLAKDLLDGRDNYGREEVLQMLFHRPTAGAIALRQAIQAGEVGFEILTREGMGELWEKLSAGREFGPAPDGIFLLPPDSPTGRPYIGVTELDPTLSREEKIAKAVLLPAFAVHEGEHFQHFGELSFKNRPHLIRAEMRASLEENFYLLFQGEEAMWEKASVLSPQGFGIFLRNLVDRDYLEGPRDLVWVKR